ncbi:lipoprotein-releasing ABC transporter permease subunit [bacterium]|nr:lipoprotein-releasing ABC transporter permease subunit [candidate division CSSED10-310 bacterium]
MRYEYFIGLRYLRARRKQTMVSVITGISIFGVALGVAALIIVLAVMTGFEEDLREKILGTNAHIVVVPYDSADSITDHQDIISRISSVPGIQTASAFVYNKVMISHDGRSDGIILKGIDPSRPGTETLQKYMVKGTIGDLEAGSGEGNPEGLPGPAERIILGIELATNLGARIGESIMLLSSASTMTPAGLLPKSRAFRVTGYFQSGMFEYDRTMAYISLQAAQGLMGLKEGVSGIEISVGDIFRTSSIVPSLRALFSGRFWVRDWKEMNRTFFSALKLEKIAMFIILTLIVFVAAFNIIGSLTMMVMEKHKDIGILKAMGASNKSIRLIFLTEGVIIGIVGTAVGCLIGMLSCWIADTFHLIRLDGEVYYISYLPFKVRLTDVAVICGASLLISFLATVYPARQAARLDPVEAIRYE